jgi:hypothetical protein
MLPFSVFHSWFDQPNSSQTVNDLVGDLSFTEAFGRQPHASTNEQLRIQTHLCYIEQLLRRKETGHLSEAQRNQRLQLLDKLHHYIEEARFPSNYDYPYERKPCFIDRKGNICAVGYLIEQSAGRALAEKINSLFQYEKIRDMHLPELTAWVNNSGLTLDECAMIQPQYGYLNPPMESNQISAGYGIGSSILGGINLSVNAINISQLNQPGTPRLVPVVGLITGTASAVWGATAYKKKERETPYFDSDQNGLVYKSYKDHNRVSLLNIGVGTLTMLTSAYKLLIHREDKPKKFTWSVDSFPTVARQNGVVLNVIQRF